MLSTTSLSNTVQAWAGAEQRTLVIGIEQVINRTSPTGYTDVVEVLFWDLRRRESPSEKPIMEFPAKKRAIKMEGLMENEFVGIH